MKLPLSDAYLIIDMKTLFLAISSFKDSCFHRDYSSFIDIRKEFSPPRERGIAERDWSWHLLDLLVEDRGATLLSIFSEVFTHRLLNLLSNYNLVLQTEYIK